MFLNKTQHILFIGKANIGFKIKSYIFFSERKENPKRQPNRCTMVAPINVRSKLKGF